MVKVRTSQIPEEDGKVIKVPKDTPSNNGDITDEEIEKLIDESLGAKPNHPAKSRADEDDDDKTEVKKYVVYFADFGITLSLFAIESIEKDMRFVDNLNNPRWQYGITINKGMKQTERFPIVDKSVWFERENVRDERYDSIMAALAELGFDIIAV